MDGFDIALSIGALLADALLGSEVASEGQVRHEVAAIIVVHRNTGDATRCPISGILRRCAGRQRPVQSLRTMYPQAQPGIETAMPRCLCQHQDGLGARMGGMGNTCERLINIVTDDKQKMLEGLS